MVPASKAERAASAPIRGAHPGAAIPANAANTPSIADSIISVPISARPTEATALPAAKPFRVARGDVIAHCHFMASAHSFTAPIATAPTKHARAAWLDRAESSVALLPGGAQLH